ncbi:gastrula zinc finger protein xFG20-1 [Sitophilus oryzae]|uniref:Gastrula zinc finger protein xFG20-1 n=1 Tax=Sitophilus oryzae TaxID=7048 RepID=A0A6J2YTH9_SITOR|nr:gastrula zinc finger protein xFG20-1 [Sitophilus oryzae]
MTSPVKFYPTVEECQRNNKVTCPIEACGGIFKSQSNLHLHIQQTHKKTGLKPSDVEKQYFCPEKSCRWSNSKYFKNMKSLRQHYFKVHIKKTYSCSNCEKSFTTDVLLERHGEFCNVEFNCLDCKSSYDCYNTLRTHCRRKRHRILEKNKYKKCNKTEVQPFIVLRLNQRILLPKELPKDQNSQTILEKPVLESKMTQVSGLERIISQASQQTQTNSRNCLSTVETQTPTNFSKPKEVFEENFKHVNTQTDIVESKECSCNTSFTLDELESTFNSYTEKNTSSTQTYSKNQDIFSISTATHDSIYTDTSDLLTDSLGAFDSNFFNCNMETQTDVMFDSDIFNTDYYTNMCTQTCNDFFSGFNDNETQTVFDETLRSVQSQTLMSTLDNSNVVRDTAHSETQTDTEFRHMLEIINS